MSGPQFINLQTFSKKPNKGGQSIDQVWSEVERDPEFSHHVENPKAPQLIHGFSVVELRGLHDAMVDSAATPVLMKDGTTRHRAIRKDRHTLLSAVASYPVPRVVVEASREETARYLEWRDRTVAFLSERYGTQLKTVLQHDDEPHLHIHGYVIPDLRPDANAIFLHDGKSAKVQAEEKAKREGLEPRAAVKIGNLALKAAMRDFQDAYHAQVGAPCGLTRTGPKRRRLTREQWKQEKEVAKKASVIEQKKTVAVLEKAEAVLDRRELALLHREATVDANLESYQKKEKKLGAAIGAIQDVVQATAQGHIIVSPEGNMKLSPEAPADFRAKAKETLGAALYAVDAKLLGGLIARIHASVVSSAGGGRKPEPEKNSTDEWLAARRMNPSNERSGPEL